MLLTGHDSDFRGEVRIERDSAYRTGLYFHSQITTRWEDSCDFYFVWALPPPSPRVAHLQSLSPSPQRDSSLGTRDNGHHRVPMVSPAGRHAWSQGVPYSFKTHTNIVVTQKTMERGKGCARQRTRSDITMRIPTIDADLYLLKLRNMKMKETR